MSDGSDSFDDKLDFALNAVKTGITVTATILAILLGSITIPQNLDSLGKGLKITIVIAGALFMGSVIAGSTTFIPLIRLAGNYSEDQYTNAVCGTNIQYICFLLGIIAIFIGLCIRLLG